MSQPDKLHVRWRRVSDGGDWSCWEINGGYDTATGFRIIVSKVRKLTKKFATEDDRVLSIIHSRERKRRWRIAR